MKMEETVKKVLSDSFLIWNKDAGFVIISEGEGCNLLPEDIDAGYVDYIYIEGLTFNGSPEFDTADGGEFLLEEYYEDKFSCDEDVVEYCKNIEAIPDEQYIILARM